MASSSNHHDQPPAGPGLLPYLMVTGTAFFWGGTFVAGKYAVADIPPIAVAMLRFAVAWFPLAFLLVFVQKQSLRLSRSDIGIFAALGFVGAALPNALIFTGVQYTSAANAALIQAAMPVITVLAAGVLVGERLGLRQWAGIVLSLLGVAYIIGNGSFGALLALDLNAGNLMILGAVTAWALNTVFSRMAVGRYTPLQVSTHMALFGGVFLGIATLIMSPQLVWKTPGLPAISAILFVAIFANVIGQVWWISGIKAVGPSRVAIFTNLQAIFGVILATLMLGERLAAFHVVGAAAVIGGVMLMIWKPGMMVPLAPLRALRKQEVRSGK